ncbi:4-fold beta flower protein [Sulfuricurvum sp.]|uniref:4-fold beta flower protein n=1 Tax=Sulfuricurvum sp. TaxID=2025608 RepID=UPI00260A79C5|nr:hypothetical protein [Sulfuricurvum sp.]MDD2266310.1 hypothetical protein [Sulfuricurvum sp.]MDD2784734.1 hypothetical protein [Sulfuricurvum sp.]
MKPVFNRHGRTIGWLHNGVIYDRTNCCRAFVFDGNVFTYNGEHLGFVQRGIFFDQRGRRIAYMDDASYDPMLPIPEITPAPPHPSDARSAPIPSAPPKAPPVSNHWSALKWDCFV